MLRRKLLLMCISLILLITAMNGVTVSTVTVRTINEEVRSGFEVEMNQLSDVLTDLLNQQRADTLELCNDSNVQQLMRSVNGGLSLSPEEISALWTTAKYDAQRLGYLNLEIVAFTDSTPVCWNSQKQQFENYAQGRQEGWFSTALYQPDIVTYSSNTYDETYVIRAAKCVYDSENWDRIIGIVALDMEMFPIVSAFNQQNAVMLLTDENNRLIYPFVDYYGFTENGPVAQDTIILNEEQYLVSHRNIPMSGWKLTGFMSSGQLYAKGQQVMHTFWVSTGIALFLAVCIAIYASDSVTKAVTRIIRKMELASDGNLEPVTYPPYYKGEIKVLYDSYNQMVKQIDTLIHEVYQAKINEQEAELRTLQAQINPHFIYNTLDTINWMAMRYRAKDIQHMVRSLATMLRFSLNNGENMISLAGEFEQIVSYINIQKIRDPDSFRVEYCIDENIMRYQVIKLILQPLVENAILHGSSGVDYQVTIRILGYLEDGHVILKVCNNGARANLEQIQRLLDPENKEKPKSYGIRNVNMRLIKQYGSQYGIQYCYDETLGETQATIRIPIVDSETIENAMFLLEDLKRQINEEQGDRHEG